MINCTCFKQYCHFSPFFFFFRGIFILVHVFTFYSQRLSSLECDLSVIKDVLLLVIVLNCFGKYFLY